MAIKVLSKWGMTTPLTNDEAIIAAFGGLLDGIADAANKALNALSEETDAIRRDNKYTLPGKVAACVAAARQAIADLERTTANPRARIAEAIDRAKSNVPTAAQLPRPENVWIGGDAAVAAARSAEIRQTLAAMDDATRGSTITVAFREQDHELVWALTGAPSVVRQSLFPDVAGLDALVADYIAKRYPERFATYGTAINAKRIADGILAQAREAAKQLSGSSHTFDGPDPLQPTADAAYRRLNQSTGQYEPASA
jgi:hypothetical protein